MDDDAVSDEVWQIWLQFRDKTSTNIAPEEYENRPDVLAGLWNLFMELVRQGKHWEFADAMARRRPEPRPDPVPMSMADMLQGFQEMRANQLNQSPGLYIGSPVTHQRLQEHMRACNFIAESDSLSADSSETGTECSCEGPCHRWWHCKCSLCREAEEWRKQDEEMANIKLQFFQKMGPYRWGDEYKHLQGSGLSANRFHLRMCLGIESSKSLAVHTNMEDVQWFDMSQLKPAPPLHMDSVQRQINLRGYVLPPSDGSSSQRTVEEVD